MGIPIPYRSSRSFLGSVWGMLWYDIGGCCKYYIWGGVWIHRDRNYDIMWIYIYICGYNLESCFLTHDLPLIDGRRPQFWGITTALIYPNKHSHCYCGSGWSRIGSFSVPEHVNCRIPQLSHAGSTAMTWQWPWSRPLLQSLMPF